MISYKIGCIILCVNVKSETDKSRSHEDLTSCESPHGPPIMKAMLLTPPTSSSSRYEANASDVKRRPSTQRAILYAFCGKRRSIERPSAAIAAVISAGDGDDDVCASGISVRSMRQKGDKRLIYSSRAAIKYGSRSVPTDITLIFSIVFIKPFKSGELECVR